jgi:hypothetical protein
MKSAKCKLTRETIIAIRVPVWLDSLEDLRRMAERNKPPGTTLYIRQNSNWFLIEARPLTTKK